jgi:hypothetical protein
MDDNFEAMQKLDRDLRASARLLGQGQARGLVDLYYQIQEYRKRTANQTRAAEDDAEPNALVSHLLTQTKVLEENARRALGEFADTYRVGRWAQSLVGVGPVITAGLLAHLDVRKAPTVGHIWRFAGLDPSLVWAAGQKRPWNADLKRLCFLAGDCFVKFSNHPKQFYGSVYVERKAAEADANERCAYRGQAERSLATKKFGKETEARKHYEAGHLPPARLHMRALRYAVKLFLSHLHHVMYRDYFDARPPVPYSFEHSDRDHRHFIPPPNWDEDDPWGAYPGRRLRELLRD